MTRPASTTRSHGTVRIMTVDAPTPIAICDFAFAPSPENSTSAPSGTEPRTGSTTEPTTLRSALTKSLSSLLVAIRSGASCGSEELRAARVARAIGQNASRVAIGSGERRRRRGRGRT